MRFADNKNSQSAWSKEADEGWLPVDLYVGGQEHAVLHLLYARYVETQREGGREREKGEGSQGNSSTPCYGADSVCPCVSVSMGVGSGTRCSMTWA
jgi:hypothetical protein